MRIFPSGRTELLQSAIGPCYGFEAKVDVSRFIDPRVSVRVEVFIEAEPERYQNLENPAAGTALVAAQSYPYSAISLQKWELAAVGNCAGLADRKNFLTGEPLQYWTFGGGFHIPRVAQDWLIGWDPKCRDPRVKIVVTVEGGDAEIDLVVENVSQAPRLVTPKPFHRSISFIQAVSGHDEGGTGATSGDMTTTSGNGIVASISLFDTFTSFGDNKGNTLSVANAFASPGGAYQSGQRYAENITGGANHNFTIVHASGGYSQFFVMEVWDMVTSGSFDENASGNGGAVTTGTLAQAREMAVGMIGPGAAVITYAADDNYVELFNVSNNTQLGLCVGYIVTRSTSAVTWDPFHNQVDPIRQVATFKEKATPAAIEEKPAGTTPTIVNTSPAWNANCVGWWIMNEASATSDGAADISGNGRHLTAFKEGALDYPGLETEQIGPGRFFDGDNTDVNGLESAVLSALSLSGAMSAMVVWRNRRQPFGGVGVDPVVFGAAREANDNCFTLCYNRTGTGRHKFGWFDDAGAGGWVSTKDFSDQDDWTVYRLMVTRSGAGNGSDEKFYYQALDGRSGLVKDVDTTGTADANGGTAAFTIGMSRWNTGPTYSQGCKCAIYEMRLWSVELSETVVGDYFDDPYLEFVSASVSGDGELVAGSAIVDGAGTSLSTGSGSLEAQSALVDGAGTSRSTGSGSLEAQAALVDGAGTSRSTGSSSLEAGSAQIDGAGTSASTGSGSLEAGSADIVGSGEGVVTGSGSLEAQSALVDGAGTSRSTGTGELVAGSADITSAEPVIGSGSLEAGSAQVDGAGTSRSTGTGDLNPGSAQVDGAGTSRSTGSGSLEAQAAIIDGAGTSRSTGTGELVAGSAEVVGVRVDIIGDGQLVASFSVVEGEGEVTGQASSIVLETLLAAALEDLVNGRMYPNVFPQSKNPLWPAIRYTIVSSTPASTIEGDDFAKTADPRVTFDLVDSQYKPVRNLRLAVLSVLETFEIPNLVETEFNTYDTETKTHRCAIDVIFYPSSEQAA